jgi:hypothetical protein
MSAEPSPQIFRGPFAGGPRDRARLSGQIKRIRAFALARDWFTLREAREELERLYFPVRFPEASLSAQLRNLEKPAAGRLRCKKEKRSRTGAGRGVWEYRLRAVPEFRSVPATLSAEAPPEKLNWPATFEELEAAGYGYTGTSKKCACGAKFLWWITPRGKWMPLSAIEGLRLVPHSAVCENAKRRRLANERRDARADPRPQQAALF